MNSGELLLVPKSALVRKSVKTDTIITVKLPENVPACIISRTLKLSCVADRIKAIEATEMICIS